MLAPTEGDAALCRTLLTVAGLDCHVCRDVGDLCRELGNGAGALLLTEEAVPVSEASDLVEALRGQPAWSDLPLVVLAGQGADSMATVWAMELLGNVTFQERPVRVTTLVSVLRAALKSRRRQYDLRDHFEALRASEERFRFLAETIPSIVWTAAPDGSLTYTNQRWLEYCGVTAEQNARGWPGLVLHPDDRERCLSEWMAALRDGSEYEIEVRNRRYDGVYRWFITRAVPLRDAEGHVVAWFGVTTDIHDQKLMQDQLREADRQKDEFLAMLAHELRNPLAPIRNALHILQVSGNDRGDTRNIRQMMERQVNHMVRLVDDLLEVSRITRGKIELRKERVALKAVVDSAVETSGPLIEAAGHQLTISLPAEPLALDADPVRLAQVIANLLNNSAKYTEDGGQIWLTARREGSEAVVSVRDSGLGIPTEMLPHIFEMFAQVDPTLKRAGGGLGIGLTLARSLVEMHGGRVEARSEGPGRGSEFTLRLPLAATRDGMRESRSLGSARQLTGLPSCRVLVVDDNRDSADSLAMLLNFTGAVAEAVYDGPAALEAIRKYRPAVVLLDVGMPQMDGHEVARRVRQDPEFQDLVLIAMTGWGQEEDRRRSAASGFDHHLVKPVEINTLQALLASLGNSEARRLAGR